MGASTRWIRRRYSRNVLQVGGAGTWANAVVYISGLPNSTAECELQQSKYHTFLQLKGAKMDFCREDTAI